MSETDTDTELHVHSDSEPQVRTELHVDADRVDPEGAGPSSVVSDDIEEPVDSETEAAMPLRFADPVELAGAIEAILFVVESPVEITTLAAAVEQPVDLVTEALRSLRDGYDERRSGIELRDVAGGVRLYTRAEHAPAVEQFLLDGQRSRLSQAALETLAVIAYRQPVTRARVSAIRGVNVDGVVRTLLARGLILEDGADPETGGVLFRTSELFLERMGLQNLDKLPSLAPLLPEVEGLDIDSLDAGDSMGTAASLGSLPSSVEASEDLTDTVDPDVADRDAADPNDVEPADES